MSATMERFWREIDQVVDDTVRSKEQVEAGSEASRILGNRHVDEWFKGKIRDIAKMMLDPNVPDSELPRWKARATALLDFYASLVVKVAAGNRAVQRMAEQSQENKDTKEK